MDYLSVREDRHLLGAAFRITAPHRLDQSLPMREGEYVVGPATLVLDETIGTIVHVDPDLIPVVLRLDGSQGLQDIVAEVADATSADRADLTTRTLALVRAMLERGFLRPPAPSGRSEHEAARD
jgi:hypothetical protein